MRPRSILQFEYILLSALALDLINNVVAWPALSERLSAHGTSSNSFLLLAICIVPPAVGFVFWYFVARRGSNAARYVLTVLVATGAAGFVYKMLGADLATDRMFLVAILAEVLKVIATSRLFTPESSRWFKREQPA